MPDLFLGQILSYCSDSVSNIQKLSYGGELEVEIVVESQMIEPDFNHKVHRIPWLKMKQNGPPNKMH